MIDQEMREYAQEALLAQEFTVILGADEDEQYFYALSEDRHLAGHGKTIEDAVTRLLDLLGGTPESES